MDNSLSNNPTSSSNAGATCFHLRSNTIVRIAKTHTTHKAPEKRRKNNIEGISTFRNTSIFLANDDKQYMDINQTKAYLNG